MKQRRALFSILNIALPLILLFQTVAVSATTSQPGDIRAASAADAAQAAPTITFTPTILPLSDPELVNPLRGLHEWRDGETIPQPETASDAYQRYFWRDPDNPSKSLETARGVYNFSAIEADIAAAAAQGKKFAFRIRAMGNDSGGKRYVPDYLSNCGWSYNGTFIPDWNASCFLDNAQNLVNALGARYNNDPRIAWMDMGLYGRWGEWASSDGIYASAPAGIRTASEATLNRIVDMQLAAFPNVRKVMFAKTDASAVAHALASSDQIGWRVDCLGKDGYFDFATNPNYALSWPYMQERWKTAPVIVEFCANNVESTYGVAVQQVRDWHIAGIGNGNIDAWSGKNSTQQANLILMGKTAGYRFEIKDVTLPQTWTPGESIAITTRWENTGVAPHYETTQVSYKLFDPARNAYVWEGGSAANLRALLPTNGSPLSVSDSLALPANLAAGSYQLRLIVSDPAGVRRPLKLAIGGRQADGAYLLGSVTVAAAGAPTPTATPVTPTATPTTAPSATPLPPTPTPAPTATPVTPTATPTTVPTATMIAPTPTSGGTTRSATFNPSADTMVSGSSPRTNFGGRTTLRLDSSPDENTYLRFNLSTLAGKQITRARLRIKLSNAAAANTVQNVKLASSDSWAERSVTYNTRPGLSSTVYGSFNGGEYGAWVEVDITALIQAQAGKTFSIGITTGNNDDFAFYSRETSNKPQLIVTYR